MLVINRGLYEDQPCTKHVLLLSLPYILARCISLFTGHIPTFPEVIWTISIQAKMPRGLEASQTFLKQERDINGQWPYTVTQKGHPEVHLQIWGPPYTNITKLWGHQDTSAFLGVWSSSGRLLPRALTLSASLPCSSVSIFRAVPPGSVSIIFNSLLSVQFLLWCLGTQVSKMEYPVDLWVLWSAP